MKAGSRRQLLEPDRVHTLVVEVVAHTTTESLNDRAAEAELALSETATMDLKEAAEGDRRAQVGLQLPRHPHLNSCFVPQTCVPTQKALKRITREQLRGGPQADRLCPHPPQALPLRQGQRGGRCEGTPPMPLATYGPEGVLLFAGGESQAFIPHKRKAESERAEGGLRFKKPTLGGDKATSKDALVATTQDDDDGFRGEVTQPGRGVQHWV